MMMDQALNYVNHEARVPIGARLVVERLYSIPVETQLDIEAYFEGLSGVQALYHPLFRTIINDDYFRFYEKYVVEYPHAVCPFDLVRDEELIKSLERLVRVSFDDITTIRR
jgi:hypothetical protein